MVSTNFKVIPTIRDFTPKTGPIGTVITIIGDNLPANVGSYYTDFMVKFGTETVSASPTPNNNVIATLPATVKTERLKVTVTAYGQAIELPGQFVVAAPIITSISPAPSLPGVSMTINGTNFSPDYFSQNKVMIGDMQASISNYSPTSVTVTVPGTCFV
jgi:hypothetical protein